jgi:hypothetical protein
LKTKYHADGYPSVIFIKENGEALAWRWGYQEGGVENWTRIVDDTLARQKK